MSGRSTRDDGEEARQRVTVLLEDLLEADVDDVAELGRARRQF